jgi:hypothetical protein
MKYKRINKIEDLIIGDVYYVAFPDPLCDDQVSPSTLSDKDYDEITITEIVYKEQFPEGYYINGDFSSKAFLNYSSSIYGYFIKDL